MVRAALYPRASQLFIPAGLVLGGVFCRRPVRAALCPAPVEAVLFQSVLPSRTTHPLPPLWLQTLYPAGRSLWRAALGAAAPPRGGPAPGPARPRRSPAGLGPGEAAREEPGRVRASGELRRWVGGGVGDLGPLSSRGGWSGRTLRSPGMSSPQSPPGCGQCRGCSWAASAEEPGAASAVCNVFFFFVVFLFVFFKRSARPRFQSLWFLGQHRLPEARPAVNV